MNVIQPQTIYARKWPILIIFLLIAGPFSFVAFAEEDKKDAMLKFPLIFLIVICTAYYLVVSRMKIIIDNDGVVFKTLLATNSIAWNQVVISKISFDIHVHASRFRWLITDANEQGIGFQIHWFSRKDNQVIAEALVSKCRFANISDKVRNMAEGKFPWYIF